MKYRIWISIQPSKNNSLTTASNPGWSLSLFGKRIRKLFFYTVPLSIWKREPSEEGKRRSSTELLWFVCWQTLGHFLSLGFFFFFFLAFCLPKLLILARPISDVLGEGWQGLSIHSMIQPRVISTEDGLLTSHVYFVLNMSAFRGILTVF